MTHLPEFINVTKVMTFDVAGILRVLHDPWKEGAPEPTLTDVLEYVEEWADEEFGGLDGLTYTDENGEELT